MKLSFECQVTMITQTYIFVGWPFRLRGGLLDFEGVQKIYKSVRKEGLVVEVNNSGSKQVSGYVLIQYSWNRRSFGGFILSLGLDISISFKCYSMLFRQSLNESPVFAGSDTIKSAMCYRFRLEGWANLFNVFSSVLKFPPSVCTQPISLYQRSMNQIKNQIKQWTKQQIYVNPAFTVKMTSECGLDPLKCGCLMCNPYQYKVQKKLLANQELKSQQNKQSRLMSRFPQSHLERVLKGLMLPTNKIVKRGVQVHIPQICFFQDGQAVNFYLTKDFDDCQLIRLKKDKITQTLMSKLFNERKRGYREKMKRLLKMEPSKREESLYKRKKQKNQKANRHQTSYVAIVRYTDGCETLISQTQLLAILQKRKTDSFWKKIAYISNYIPQIKPLNTDPTSLDITFDSQKPLYLQLWRRANQLMQTYSGRLLPSHPSYISSAQQTEFCQKLRQESSVILASYVFYKIAAFMATFADQKILSAVARMFVNEIGQCFLLQVRKLTILPLLKYSFTNQIYEKMVHQNQEKKYHKGQLQLNQQTIAKSEAINALMADQYQSLKKRYGVTVEPKEDLNQKLNNQFFAFLHPNLEGNISQLIRLDIPLTTFRRKFLGEKQERKPLFRQFNSRLVRELHQLTPNPKRLRDSSIKATQDSTSRTIPWRRRNISSFSHTIGV